MSSNGAKRKAKKTFFSPAGTVRALALAETVTVADIAVTPVPSPVSVVGLNVHVADDGMPVHESDTVPANLPKGAKLKFADCVWPCCTEMDTLVEFVGAAKLAGLTVIVAAGEVAGRKFASPAYCTVSECDPVASAADANVATPCAVVIEPICVALSSSVTLPVGVWPTEELIVAVAVLVCP